jgi:hypothetical protein
VRGPCYDGTVNPADLREYASRGRWAILEREKDRWRAERFRVLGPQGTVAASLALREQGWRIAGAPTEERRREDLAHHVELKRKLERVSRAFGA